MYTIGALIKYIFFAASFFCVANAHEFQEMAGMPANTTTRVQQLLDELIIQSQNAKTDCHSLRYEIKYIVQSVAEFCAAGLVGFLWIVFCERMLRSQIDSSVWDNKWQALKLPGVFLTVLAPVMGTMLMWGRSETLKANCTNADNVKDIITQLSNLITK